MKSRKPPRRLHAGQKAAIGQLGQQPRQTRGTLGAEPGAGLTDQLHEIPGAVEQLGQVRLLSGKAHERPRAVVLEHVAILALGSVEPLERPPRPQSRLGLPLPPQWCAASPRLPDHHADPRGHGYGEPGGGLVDALGHLQPAVAELQPHPGPE
ncbi:MAG: hypothetical protein M3Z27_05120 [Actinomycetota bacterium]|nr:hypothetical protein [Actinomycetota bacterium]